MLVLGRYLGERILIGDDIVVSLLEICSDNKARIGIVAPRDIVIMREEIAERYRSPAASAERQGVAPHSVQHVDVITDTSADLSPEDVS